MSIKKNLYMNFHIALFAIAKNWKHKCSSTRGWIHTHTHTHTMGETWIGSLGWEDPLEEGMATHSSILAWRIPRDRGAWWAAVHGVTEV